MAEVLQFRVPASPQPMLSERAKVANELDSAYAELIDAYNDNAEAQRLLAGTTTRLQWALKRFEDAQRAAGLSHG